jgi:hypothetical protein
LENNEKQQRTEMLKIELRVSNYDEGQKVQIDFKKI